MQNNPHGLPGGSAALTVVPRPSLDAVVEAMRKLAHEGKADMRVRRLAERILEHVTPNDYAAECFALYAWVDQNIRYVRDPHDVEFVKTPWQLVRSKTGDCDDMATLLAALAMSVGNKCVFSLVSFTPQRMPAHVFCCVVSPGGKLIPLDPVANREHDLMHKQITHRWDIPV